MSNMQSNLRSNATVSPMMTPQTMATNKMHNPVPPLSTSDMAAKDGVLCGGNSPAVATQNTAVAEVANSDTKSPKVPTQYELPQPDTANMSFKDGTGQDGNPCAVMDIQDAGQASKTLAEQTLSTTEQNHNPTNDNPRDEACADYRAEAAVYDLGSHISLNTETVSTSVKGKQSTKRRTKTTIDPDDLPSKDDELSEAQIASLCYQPPRVRQGYTKYFAAAGTIRAAYANILMERLPNGERRFSEDILRSCLPKWKDRKDRLEVSHHGDSAQTGSGPSRKRKGPAAPAKRVADEDIEPPKKTKRLNVSKTEKSKDPPPDLGSNDLNPHPLQEPRHQTLRFRSVITPGTALSRGLPPSAISSKSPTALQAGSSEPFPSEASETPYSQQPKVQNQPSDITVSNINPSLDNRKSFYRNHIPTQGTGVQNHGNHQLHNHNNCQLLDPNHLSQFAQYLTGEIQQLDLAIVSIAHGAHDQGRRYPLRHLRDVLIDLHDLCVDMEIEQ